MDKFFFWGLTGLFTSLTVVVSIYYFKGRTNNKRENIAITDKKSNNNVVKPVIRSPPNNRQIEEIKMDFSLNGIIQDIQKTRNKHLNSLPIAVDIPRLAKNFKIYNKNNEELFEGAKFEENFNDQQTVRIYLIYELLQVLLNVFLQEDSKRKEEQSEEEYLQFLTSKKEQFKAHFDEIVKADGDTSLYVRQLFNEHIPDENKVTSLLKVCNQSILAAVVVRMKCSFGESYPYKDKRGRWFILIQFPFPSINDENNINIANNNNNDGGRKQIVVTHRKEEISWDDGSIDHFISFTFTWELRMYFDVEVKEMYDAQMAIVDFQLLEETSDENIRKLYNCILSCSYLRLECNFFDKYK